MGRRISLADVAAGETVHVLEVLGGRGIHNRLSALGIRPGAKVTKVSGSLAWGPTVVRCGETQTALGRGICTKIIVESP